MKNELCIAAINSIQGFHITVKLTDDTVQTLDLEPYLWGEAAQELKSDPKKFNAVYVEDGTLVWPTGQDICLDELLKTETFYEQQDIMHRVAERWLKEGMATICEFSNIKIRVDGLGGQYQDKLPHIHAICAGEQAQIAIEDGSVLKGELKSTKLKLVKKWLELRQQAVFKAWMQSVMGKAPNKVLPL